MTFKTFLKITWNIALWLFIGYCSLYYDTTIYVFFQAKGQFHIVTHTKSIEEYRAEKKLSGPQLQNLELISRIKTFSVDSLAYIPTRNFTSIYEQGNEPLLWVISASEKYRIRAYYWDFPLVGMVSYKGFFEKKKAEAEKNKMICAGYDVDLRPVSAWSTLGWLSDPILSSMLNKSKGNLCNLIFHELFHATYYAKSSVDYNENLASFVAHKATIRFLRSDTSELNRYLDSYNDNLLTENHLSIKIKELNNFYDSISGLTKGEKDIFRLKKMNEISMSLTNLHLSNKKRAEALKKQILEFKNAWFVDFNQYNGLQDSLERVFNKFYQSDLRKMVQSLK
jgi:predicted aminopeptidase